MSKPSPIPTLLSIENSDVSPYYTLGISNQNLSPNPRKVPLILGRMFSSFQNNPQSFSLILSDALDNLSKILLFFKPPSFSNDMFENFSESDQKRIFQTLQKELHLNPFKVTDFDSIPSYYKIIPGSLAKIKARLLSRNNLEDNSSYISQLVLYFTKGVPSAIAYSSEFIDENLQMIDAFSFLNADFVIQNRIANNPRSPYFDIDFSIDFHDFLFSYLIATECIIPISFDSESETELYVFNQKLFSLGTIKSVFSALEELKLVLSKQEGELFYNHKDRLVALEESYEEIYDLPNSRYARDRELVASYLRRFDYTVIDPFLAFLSHTNGKNIKELSYVQDTYRFMLECFSLLNNRSFFTQLARLSNKVNELNDKVSKASQNKTVEFINDYTWD